MDFPKLLAGAAVVALNVTAGGAQAADLFEPPIIEPLMPVEYGSNWYLRGDIGYKAYTDPSGSYSSLGTGVIGYYDTSIDNSWLIGAGFGYRFNPWFRTDLTVDYEFPSDFTGKAPCFVCGFPGYSTETAKISAWTVLANAYLDLGTWQGITPYVGAGIGGSYVKVADYLGVNPPAVFPIATVGASASKWNLAWAAMAGVSYDVTPNWTLDLNYRYLSLGDVQTNDQVGGLIDIEDIAAHEVRLGVRFWID